MKPTTVWGVIKRSLHEQRLLLAALVAVIAAATALESVPAFILKKVVDDHIARGAAQGIWALAVFYFLALVAQRAVGFGQDYLTTVIGQGILHDLRLALTSHLRALGLSYYDSTPVGEIMSRSTADVEAVNTLFTSGVVSMIADSCKLLGVIGPMFALSAHLAWVTLAVAPVIAIVTELFRRNIRAAQRWTRKAVGLINSTFEESLSGIKVVRAYGQERAFRRLLGDNLRQYLVAANRASLFNSYFTPAMDILRGMLTAALVYVGVILAGGTAASGLTTGTLVAFLTQMVPRLFNPLTSLSDELQTIQEALAGTERINEVLLQPPEERPSWLPLPATTPGRVVISGLSFGYNAPRAVLRDINLEVPPGQRLAIVGRTGAGKTSLLSLIAGVYAPWEGSIAIDGIDPRRVRPEERRRLLGVVPQTVHLIDGTIRENITLGDRTIGDDDIVRVARIVGLDDYIRTLPAGYDTLLGPGGTKLSHGQEQLLSLARALVCDPAVLLLDEPTSGLDADTEGRLFAAIREESSKRTTITISHRMSGVMDAERVVVMAGGRIVQDGSPAELAREDGWYAMMRALESLGWASEASS